MAAAPGDMDADRDVDFDDIDDFLLGLTDPKVYENAIGVPPDRHGDADADGDLDFDDINPFVAILEDLPHGLSAQCEATESGNETTLDLDEFVMALLTAESSLNADELAAYADADTDGDGDFDFDDIDAFVARYNSA